LPQGNSSKYPLKHDKVLTNKFTQVQQERIRPGHWPRLQLCSPGCTRRLAQPHSGSLLRRRPLLVLHATEPCQVHGCELDSTDLYRHSVPCGTAVQWQDEPVALTAQSQVRQMSLSVLCMF